jgi:hypothetical protein
MLPGEKHSFWGKHTNIFPWGGEALFPTQTMVPGENHIVSGNHFGKNRENTLFPGETIVSGKCFLISRSPFSSLLIPFPPSMCVQRREKGGETGKRRRRRREGEREGDRDQWGERA